MASVARRVVSVLAVLSLAACSTPASTMPSSPASPATTTSASPSLPIGQPSAEPTEEPGAGSSPEPSPEPSAAPVAACPSGRPLSVFAYTEAQLAREDAGEAACYGDRDVTILGWADAPPAIGWEPPGIVPGWLWASAITIWDHASCPRGDSSDRCSFLMVHIDPTSGLELKTDGRWVLVTGHTADPLAERCHYVYPDDWTEGRYPDSSARDACRASFVVTKVTEPKTAAGPILPPGSRITPLVDNLRVRSGPGLDSKADTTINRGKVLTVLDNPNFLWPVLADGYAWYYVEYTDAGVQTAGWVAQDDASTLLTRLPSRCDRASEIELSAFELLDCYGDRTITIKGTFGYCGCGGTSALFSPRWLSFPFSGHPLQVHAGTGFGLIVLRVPPPLEWKEPDGGSILRVVGHLDDPAAARCQFAYPQEDGSMTIPDPRAALLYCREQFVVESYEVIGVDPSWQSG